MNNLYEVHTSYWASGSATVELPEGKTWDDVKDWYVKWHILHIRFEGQSDYIELELCSDIEPDLHRPADVSVYPVCDTGDINYEKPGGTSMGLKIPDMAIVVAIVATLALVASQLNAKAIELSQQEGYGIAQRLCGDAMAHYASGQWSCVEESMDE